MSCLPSWLALGPASTERPAATARTVVGVLDASQLASVDAAGLVTLPGRTWSLDWWIGAADRWHLPAREPAVRQRRLGAGPVVETSARIPGGDAVQRVWASRAGGGEVLVVEVENRSPTPVALALALRPYADQGAGSLPAVDVQGTTVTVDGDPAIWLPRPPNEAGAAIGSDLVDHVTAGRSLTWPGPVTERQGRLTAAVVYPLPHTARLRVVLPLSDPWAGPAVVPPSVADSEAVSRGWDSILDAGTQVMFPDPAFSELAGSCRARILLAAAQLPAALAEVAPGAGRHAAALAAGGHETEAMRAVAALADAAPGRPRPEAAIETAGGVALAAGLADDRRLEPAVTDLLVDLVSSVDRRRTRHLAGPALAAVAAHAARVGHAEAAADLERRAGSAGRDPWAWADRVPGAEALTAELQATGATGAFPGDDLDRAARGWLDLRRLLVVEGAHAVSVLPQFWPAWRGGVAQVDRLPTLFGRLSFAIRWHGYRPALLWEWERRPGDAVVPLRCPGLDPSWSSTDDRGETLLAGTPTGLGRVPGEGESFR